MEAITLPIYNLQGQEVESLKLNTAVFDGTINQDAVHQAIVAYQANQRRGLAATKTRGEVSGGGKKPWRQKGTGRARVGSIRSPLWRHGGVIFGPHPRDFSYNLPAKIRSLALKSTLNAKIKDSNFVILDNFDLNSHKTKDAAKIFTNLKLDSKDKPKSYSILLLLDKTNDSIKRSLRNIGFIDVNLAPNTNPYEVLSHQKVVITKAGLGKLTERLK
jgi:large subunit ribosomal protein L4